MEIPSNFTINIYNEDFLLFNFEEKYDLAIGNPPYSKLKNPSSELLMQLLLNVNTDTKNLSEMFLEKCLRIADCTSLVLNKTILSTAEFDKTR
jgi:DNA (cytosine-5)-methyltransferase 1